MKETLLERIVDNVTKVPGHIVEIVACALTFGAILSHMAPHGPANAVVNAAIGAGLTVALLRYTGWADRIASRLRLGPQDKIQGKIRLADFALFHEVEIEGDGQRVWRRLADIWLKPNGSGQTEIYDILIDPVSHGTDEGSQVFRVILYRHNDDSTWPVDISFEQGVVSFNFRSIDREIPPITISLRTGPKSIHLRRSAPVGERPAPDDSPPRFDAKTRYDRVAQAIIGRGPRSTREVGILRRKVGKALHPDGGSDEDRTERQEAMKRANVYLDQFKP